MSGREAPHETGPQLRDSFQSIKHTTGARIRTCFRGGFAVTADRLLRDLAEFFFGPMYEWRLTRWLIRRRGGNPSDYEGLGKRRS